MKQSIRAQAVLLGLLLLAPVTLVAQLKVATLHPLLADLARNIGGEQVVVLPLLKEGGDPHSFEPTPGDLQRAAGARLVLASGKGLEPYLDKVRGNLREGQELYEVGRKVPSLTIDVGPVFICCPAHSRGALDPHWWHGISSMQRAARYLGDEFARVDPANAAAYKARVKAYDKRLDELHDWAKRELAKIPRADRKIATAHAAFGYFCKEFGLKAVPVQGLNRERDPSPQYLAETIEILKKHRVKAVFPETLANPKVLESMIRETGVKLGGALIGDGSGTGEAATFEGMIRHNVNTIVKSLAGE